MLPDVLRGLRDAPECLLGQDERAMHRWDKREAVSDALRQRFILFPFDVVAAEFGLRRMNKRDIKLIAADADRSRHAVKVDWMIVGIAVRENVSLCTRDDRQAKHFRRIAPTGLRTGPPSDFLVDTGQHLEEHGDWKTEVVSVAGHQIARIRPKATTGRVLGRSWRHRVDHDGRVEGEPWLRH